MSTDLLAPLARLVTTADAIEGLRDLFAAEEPLDDIAARVAATAVAAIPYANAVSITVLSWPDARTAASTHGRALELDRQQYASGRGPCLEAGWRRTPVRAVIGAEHQRWPEFVEDAQRVGIRASLSVPLLIGGIAEEQELVGSLNIYSDTASAFDPFDAALMRLYTLAALPRNCHPARESTPLAFRHRHGQRSPDRAAPLRARRGVHQTGRISTAQHQSARRGRRTARPAESISVTYAESISVTYFLKASLTFSPASLRLDFAWSPLPSFSVLVSPVTLPTASLALPPRFWALFFALSAPLTVCPPT